MVQAMFTPLCPRLMVRLLYRVVMGKKAPWMHRRVSILPLSIHFSPPASRMNSSAIMPRPSRAGKETNATKRSILRNICT